MASNIGITGKNKNSYISYIPGDFWCKVTDSADEPVVQYDVPAAKSTSLWCHYNSVDDDNDNRK